MSALMFAAYHNAPECVKILADSEGRLQNSSGTTALMMAVHNGNVEIARMLLHETEMKQNEGKTALVIAIIRNKIDCVKLLYPLERKQKFKNRSL